MQKEDALYNNPRLVEVCDFFNSGRTDLDFYLSKFPAAPAHALDIGAGTGSCAIELSELGYSVTAVEPAHNMLEFAKQKTGAESVDWHHGTIEEAKLVGQFDFAYMIGHAFQCLLSDQEITSFFEHTARSLRPNGKQFFESRNPTAKTWENWTPQNATPPETIPSGTKVQCLHSVIEVSDELVTFEENYQFDDNRNPIISQSTLRFAPKEDIVRIANNAQLYLTGYWTDWQSGTNGTEMIFEFTKTAN